MLVKVRGGWRIRSKKTNHLYPKIYKNKEDAKAQIARHSQFKHMEK